MHRARGRLEVVERLVAKGCTRRRRRRSITEYRTRRGTVAEDRGVRRGRSARKRTTRGGLAVEDFGGIRRLAAEGSVRRGVSLGSKDGSSWRNLVAGRSRCTRSKVFKARRSSQSPAAKERGSRWKSGQHWGFVAVCCVCVVVAIMADEGMSMFGTRTAWTFAGSTRGVH